MRTNQGRYCLCSLYCAVTAFSCAVLFISGGCTDPSESVEGEQTSSLRSSWLRSARNLDTTVIWPRVFPDPQPGPQPGPAPGHGNQDGCESANEELPSYVEKCRVAMGGIEVPKFDCNKGVEVPDTQGDGAPYPNETCDRPNVLNHACDPGSRFQVLVDQENAVKQRVVIVAHCRRKGSSPGRFQDVAVIAYNYTTGDTCFFQDRAPGTEDTGDVPAPKDDPSGAFWGQPPYVAGINCVGCHDNGPFVRSPYLTQLKGTPTTEAGGTELPEIVAAQADAASRTPKAILPGSRDASWNSHQPYRFVGSNFQGWKAYALSVQKSAYPSSSKNVCTSCHRMGISSIEFGGSLLWSSGGTSLAFGVQATGDGADRQTHKNPHTGTPGEARTSPIWMLPTQTTYDPTAFTEAQLVRDCAKDATNGGATGNGCNYVQYAQGNTCPGPALTATVNGGTVSRPTNDPHVDVVDVPAGGDVAFGGWVSLHGPFVEFSKNAAYGQPGFDGTIASLDIVGNHYQLRAGWDGPSSATPRAGAGGKVEFTAFNEISGMPTNPACWLNKFDVSDLAATSLYDKNAIDSGFQTVDAPTTFIGNLSFALERDFFGVRVDGTDSLLERRISQHGAFEGRAFAYGCGGWKPTYSVVRAGTAGDIELIAAPNGAKHRCFLTGISGDWSKASPDATVQPYAEIYRSGQSIRLRAVSAMPGNNPVFAEASCIQIQP